MNASPYTDNEHAVRRLANAVRAAGPIPTIAGRMSANVEPHAATIYATTEDGAAIYLTPGYEGTAAPWLISAPDHATDAFGDLGPGVFSADIEADAIRWRSAVQAIAALHLDLLTAPQLPPAFIEARRDYVQAAARLARVWDTSGASDMPDEAAKGYPPYLPDFSEHVLNLTAWQ